MEATEILKELFTSGAASDPYPRYADLHATDEAFHPTPWSSVFVSGYAAIQSVLRAPVFETQGSAGLDESFPAWREHPSISKNSVLDLNGAGHTRVRGLMSQAFSHHRVAGLARRSPRPRPAFSTTWLIAEPAASRWISCGTSPTRCRSR